MRYMRGSHGVFNDKERGGAGKLVLALLSAVRKDVFSDLLLPAIVVLLCSLSACRPAYCCRQLDFLIYMSNGDNGGTAGLRILRHDNRPTYSTVYYSYSTVPVWICKRCIILNILSDRFFLRVVNYRKYERMQDALWQT
jgi:hypothetical protein